MKKNSLIAAAVIFVLIVVAAVMAVTGGFKQTDKTVQNTTGSAVQTEQIEIDKRPNGPTVYVNGKEMPSGSQLENNVVMVAAHELTDMLEGDYKYSDGKIKLSWDDYSIELEIGSAKAKCGDESIKVKAPYVDENENVMVPAIKCARALGAGTMKMDGELYITQYAGINSIPQGYNVPVLMYHAVGDDTFGSAELFVSENNLEQQLKYITENGYTTITFEDLYRIDEIEKPVMLTFDDGYDNNYDLLYPLLKKYNCKATIFVITYTFSDGYDSGAMHKMTKEQVKELSDSGLVSIQSHTVMHYKLGTLSDSEQEAQFKQSRKDILKVTGKQPFVMCYPEGSYNSTTTQLVDEYYQYGIKMVGGLYNTSDDAALVDRYYISRYTDIDTFAGYIN